MLFFCPKVRVDGMENIEVLRRIITVLDRHTTKIENNVRFGKYPFIAEYEGNIRIFEMMGEEALTSLTGWLLPVGIPFMVKYTGNRHDEEDGTTTQVDRVRVMGYYLGNALYIHDEIYNRYVVSDENAEEKIFFTPVLEDFVHITPGGWSAEEQHNFSKYLWQFATKSMSGDFREVADINFEAAMDIKRDILFKDGWVTNKVAGRNIFYGITECPVEQHNVSDDIPDGQYLWYNRYLTILDVTGGNGIQTFGMATYQGNYHPHVSGGGGLCRGNAQRTIQNKLNVGQLTEFFIFMKDFLSHYHSENPFCNLPVYMESGGTPIKGSKHIIGKIYHSSDRPRDD